MAIAVGVVACVLSLSTARADLLVNGGIEFVAAGTQAMLSFLATTPVYDRVVHWHNVSLTVLPELPTFTAGLLLVVPFAWSSLRRIALGRRVATGGFRRSSHDHFNAS